MIKLKAAPNSKNNRQRTLIKINEILILLDFHSSALNLKLNIGNSAIKRYDNTTVTIDKKY